MGRRSQGRSRSAASGCELLARHRGPTLHAPVLRRRGVAHLAHLALASDAAALAYLIFCLTRGLRYASTSSRRRRRRRRWARDAAARRSSAAGASRVRRARTRSAASLRTSGASSAVFPVKRRTNRPPLGALPLSASVSPRPRAASRLAEASKLRKAMGKRCAIGCCVASTPSARSSS